MRPIVKNIYYTILVFKSSLFAASEHLRNTEVIMKVSYEFNEKIVCTIIFLNMRW